MIGLLMDISFVRFSVASYILVLGSKVRLTLPPFEAFNMARKKMPKFILNNWCMTEGEEGEYESQKEVRAPTDNDIPNLQIRTWDHIKAPSKESRHIEYVKDAIL